MSAMPLPKHEGPVAVGEQEPILHIAPEVGAVAVAEVGEKPAFSAFEKSVAELAEEVSEIAEKKEAIEQGGADLIDTYGIHPEVFDDKSKALFFSALADRHQNLKSNKDKLTPDVYAKEAAFVEDATIMLVGKQSDTHEAYKSRISTSEQEDDAEKDEVRILEKYTNAQVTADLQAAIDAGLLDDVKKRLKIDTDHPEDPFVLHVLNIAADDAPFHGMQPGMPKDVDISDYKNPAVKEALKDHASFTEYAEGLKRNGKEFQKELAMSDIPPAWIVALNGEVHLNLPLPFAEKLAYPDETRNADLYSEQNYEADRGILGHEFTHTQGGLLLDHSLYYGLMLEEYRAERESGDKQGYQEVKGFLGVDMNLVAGAKIPDLIEESVKGGERETFYPELTRRIGLQHTLELALLVPHNYVTDSRPAQKAVNEHLGGLNGYLESMYNADPTKREKAADKIKKWVEAQDTPDKVKASQSWLSMRSGMYELTFTSGLLQQALERQTADLEK